MLVYDDHVDSIPGAAGQPSREELLELDLDMRLHSIVLQILGMDELDDWVVAAFLRLAYGAGYEDALSEPCRGQLLRDHGYRVPSKRRREGEG